MLKKIFIVSGKGRHGKDTVCSFIKEMCQEKELKVINLAYGQYIKNYLKEVSDWNGLESSKKKYRKEMQKIGDIARNKIDILFFIKRLCDDIKFYSNFFDIITISDARFKDELDIPFQLFDNVIKINVKRTNFKTDLTLEEQNHITETALDNYNDYHYVISNDSTLDALKDKIRKILEGELK